MKCEFCGDARATTECPYCKGIFHPDCLTSHYVGVPRCGAINDVPVDVISGARSECGFDDKPEDEASSASFEDEVPHG